MSFPSWLTIELSNHCNYNCAFCGRHAARKAGTLKLGEMDIKLFRKILSEYSGKVLQFSKDGDPLMYPHLWQVGYECGKAGKITNIVTNGLLLYERRKEVIEFDTVVVSVHRDDDEQFQSVKKFVESVDMPVLIKFLGDYDNVEYRALGLKTTRRRIHAGEGDYNYEKVGILPIPELNICLDFLFKPSISWNGDFSICNRYDPNHNLVVGNCNTQTLKEIWNSEERKVMESYHRAGRRDMIPGCAKCQFWGLPIWA